MKYSNESPAEAMHLPEKKTEEACVCSFHILFQNYSEHCMRSIDASALQRFSADYNVERQRRER